jgi:hypothetical protein
MKRFSTRREQLEYLAVVEAGPEALARFEEMIANGESVSMAATLATRTPPRTGVDDRMTMANGPKASDVFKNEPWMLDLYRRNYKTKTGEDLPADAIVFRGLAEYPGDPGAIVTHKHSLAEVKKTMKVRNVRVEGDWENHPVSAPPKPQEVLINDQVMARYKAEYRMEEEYRNVSDTDLETEIIHRHCKVVTPDDVMNTPTSISEAYDNTFDGTQWESKE